MHESAELVQECLFHWWQQRDQYSEDRGANRRTFMNRVLTNRLRDIRREEQAEKRHADREALSLDAPVGAEDEDVTSLVDFLADDDVAAQPETHAQQADLAAAIDRARDRLTPRQQVLVDGLRAERTVSELSRMLGTSRSTLYDEMERIKASFEADGLRDFLD